MLCSLNANADQFLRKVEGFAGFNLNKTEFMKNLGLSLNGWFEPGFSINPDDPDNGSNNPITFNDRANEFNLHEMYLILQHKVKKSDTSWDVGFRADILYGTDGRFTLHENFDEDILSVGASKHYRLSIPQVYVDLFAPIGNGLTTYIGHFYTIIGKEMITAPDNFFFSHAYTMQYSEPFTHTGILSKYPLNDNLIITAGVVTGWDSFLKQPVNFLGNFKYEPDDKRFSVVLSLVTGPASRDNRHSNRSMYSFVFNYNLTDKFHYTLEHDFGIEENRPRKGVAAKWYGLNQYFIYDYSKTIGVGLRAEWYRDEDGVRVAGAKNSYFAVTGGVNWFVNPWLVIRPELRYDIATKHPVYDDSRKKDQLLFSVDAVIRF